LVGVNSGLYEQTEKAYRDFNKDNFDPTKTHVNQALTRALGERRASPYLIRKLSSIAGTRRHRFGLSLGPEEVTIASASLPEQHVPSNRGI